MKIVFIENRLRTYAWQWMADFLEEKGCEIYWIVENHYYTPRGNNIMVIPYPKKKDIYKYKEKGMPNDLYEYVAFIDRNVNYYGCEKPYHYYYYYNVIKDFIEKVNPNYIFGECTQFHELLTIGICKEKNIRFLHPSSCRYPVDRFSFYHEDLYDPIGGSGEEYSYQQALDLANSIAERSTQPSYMNKQPFSWQKFIASQREKLVNTYCFFYGEHFCTPSPWKKIILEYKKEELYKKWNLLALSKKWKERIDNNFIIMYPMQMQPEANLDVWGYPYKDQTNTIKKISDHLREGEILLVKANPKAKYELTDELLDLISSRDNIVCVELSTTMSSIFSKIGMVVAVTGTIVMECILSNKPIVSLAKNLNTMQRNCVFLKDLKGLRRYIDMVRNGNFVNISDDERVHYINELVRTSYVGQPYGEKDRNVLLALQKELLK